MIYVVYPLFFITLLIFISIYKHERIGGFSESEANYIKAEQKYTEKWKEKEKIRIDKQNREKQLDEIKENKRGKHMK